MTLRDPQASGEVSRRESWTLISLLRMIEIFLELEEFFDIKYSVLFTLCLETVQPLGDQER
jgi:hypothetical protein